MNKLDYDFARFELYRCQNGNGGSFDRMLYDLITKANLGNRHKIAMAFPLEVKVWEEWTTSDSPDKYLEECQYALNEPYHNIKEILRRTKMKPIIKVEFKHWWCWFSKKSRLTKRLTESLVNQLNQDENIEVTKRAMRESGSHSVKKH